MTSQTVGRHAWRRSPNKQYGKSLSITKIREVAGIDKQGTNVFGMVTAAEQLGFTAEGVRGKK